VKQALKQIYKVVPNIPSINDRGWNSALVQIQQPFLRLGKFDDAIETLIQAQEGLWTIILHWVIRKKWNEKHKIPGDRVRNKDYEALGALYFWILELCIQVHAFERSGYLSAAEWFACIIKHERDGAYRTIFEVASGARTSPSKTEISNYLAEKASALKKFKYPYDPPEFWNPYDSEKDPHMHKLIAAATRYAETASNFRKQYWKPFVATFSAWAEEFSRPVWNIRYAKDGNLYRTSGKGRNQGITIPLPSDTTMNVTKELIYLSY